MHIYIYIYMYACLGVGLYTHIYIYIYICIHTERANNAMQCFYFLLCAPDYCVRVCVCVCFSCLSTL